MKTTISGTIARLTGMTIGLALFAGVAGAIKADESTFKGGARLLMTSAAPAASSDYKPMSCANCKDAYVTRTDWSARGANKPLVTIARHLCQGCETTMTTEGQGKARHDVASHKCNAGGAASLNCCSTKKAGQ